MGTAYADVIGDPIVQSKSPLIHRRWLEQLGIPGDYRATRLRADELAGYFANRRRDPDWRGCNVTMPYKQAVVPLLDRLTPRARALGAVNCVTPGAGGLTGDNTDVDGVAAALDGAAIAGRKAVLIGAGGAARAALLHFAERKAGAIAIVVRDPNKVTELASETGAQLYALDACQGAFEAAAVIVNASPLGMAGSPAMPASLLDCVAAAACGATLLDMVYKPIRTEFLEVGAANGGTAVHGLVMLIGQARAAFKLFFGQPAPAGEAELRILLLT